MNGFSYSQQYVSSSGARVGVIHTPHGDIHTPAFIPVGTQATVKSLTPGEIADVGTQMFFVNTYHMAMRPGIDIIALHNGLHSFMKWNGPIITDSGGFQVFSLAKGSSDEPSLVKISEEGVQFRSHWDGSYHQFTPEISMEFQWKLGSDIHIAFDDCTPYPVSHQEAQRSMERTHRWATRSLTAHNSQLTTHNSQLTTHNSQPYQALYGSIQGSIYEDLRKQSAKFIVNLNTDGIAIGGVAVGESKQEMTSVLDWVVPELPDDKPRHLLGVGEIDDIFMLIEHGIDTFDCVHPTRIARAGYLYQQRKIIDVNKTIYSRDLNSIDPDCTCYTCSMFSLSYIHHLFKVRELLAYRLATIHNLHYIHTLVSTIRKAIASDTFTQLKKMWLSS